MIPAGMAEAEIRNRAQDGSRSYEEFRNENGEVDPFFDEEDDLTDWRDVDLGGFPTGLELVRVCFKVVWRDKEILLYQTVSLALVLSILLVFLSRMFPGWDPETIANAEVDPSFLLALYLFSVVAAVIGVYFKAASIAVATIRIKGGNPTVYDGLAAATNKIIPLVGWALILTTVGFILGLLSRRGRGARLASSVGRLAWNVATYFVIPVMLFEDDDSSINAIARSGSIVKRTWKESLAGNFGMGVPFLLLFLLGLFTVGPLGLALGGHAGFIIAIVIYCTILGIVSASTSAVLVAALYRLARTGLMPKGFDAYEEFGTRFSEIRPHPARTAHEPYDAKLSTEMGMRVRI